MSIESEILRIQHNVADTYAAVADKGGTVPSQPTSANLAAAVASIPAGGVTSLNGESGAITLEAGDNVSIEKNGKTITVSAAGGGASLFMFSISDDGHLLYSYTGADPQSFYIDSRGHLCIDA